MKQLVRILSVYLAVMMSACDNEKYLFWEIDDLTEETIVSGEDGDVFIISIHSNDSWTASFPETSQNWLQLGKAKGQGDGSIVLSVDPDYSGTGRETVLNICSDKITRQIKIVQNRRMKTLGTTDYSSLAVSKGLGQGYDVMTQKKKNQLVNLKALQKLVKNYGSYYEGLIQQSNYPALEGEIYMSDSIESKLDSLNVGVHMEIGYAVFNVNVDGEYVAGEFRYDSTMTMNIGVRYPMLEVNADCPSVIAYFDEAQQLQEDGHDLDEEQQLLSTLYSGEFKMMRADIDRLCSENPDFNDNAALNKSLTSLVDKFGVSVTFETLLGGSVAINMSVDTAYTSQRAGIQNAKVNATLYTALFSIEMGVSAEFIQESKEIINHSGFRFKIMGGSPQKQADIWKSLANKDVEAVRSAIPQWIESLELSGNGSVNNTELIDCNLYPLWMFFNGESRTCVKEFIRQTCVDSTGVLELMMKKY